MDNKVWNVSCTVLNWIYLFGSFNCTAELCLRQFQHFEPPEMQNLSPCDVPPVSSLRTLKVQQTSFSTHANRRLTSSGCRRDHSRSVDTAAASTSSPASRWRTTWAERRQLPWAWNPGSYPPLDYIRTSSMVNSTPVKANVGKQIKLPEDPFKVSCYTGGDSCIEGSGFFLKNK